jgi:hypothetical protein
MCPELWCRKLATYDQAEAARTMASVRTAGAPGPGSVVLLGRSGEAPPGCPGDREAPL